jgi:hypothetical protein
MKTVFGCWICEAICASRRKRARASSSCAKARARLLVLRVEQDLHRQQAVQHRVARLIDDAHAAGAQAAQDAVALAEHGADEVRPIFGGLCRLRGAAHRRRRGVPLGRARCVRRAVVRLVLGIDQAAARTADADARGGVITHRRCPSA